jgi:hypothetical protein
MNFIAGSSWTLVSAPLNPVNSGHTAMRRQMYLHTAALKLGVDGANLSEGTDRA